MLDDRRRIEVRAIPRGVGIAHDRDIETVGGSERTVVSTQKSSHSRR